MRSRHSPFAAAPAPCLNKIDIPGAPLRAGNFVLPGGAPISAVTGEGGTGTGRAWSEWGGSAGRTEPRKNGKGYTYESPFTVAREGGGFRVEGKPVLRAVAMTDFENDEAVSHLQNKLRRMGLFKTLKRLGARPGESIYIGDTELEYRPE